MDIVNPYGWWVALSYVLTPVAAVRVAASAPRVEPVHVPVAAATSAPVVVSAPAAAVVSHHRVHVVRARETISSIAAQYGVQPSAILAANPRVEPRRLRVGQSLTLP